MASTGVATLLLGKCYSTRNTSGGENSHSMHFNFDTRREKQKQVVILNVTSILPKRSELSQFVHPQVTSRTDTKRWCSYSHETRSCTFAIDHRRYLLALSTNKFSTYLLGLHCSASRTNRTKGELHQSAEARHLKHNVKLDDNDACS